MPLTERQYVRLLRPINPERVRQLDGNDHLEAWDVRRTLTRIFGFGGWDDEVQELTLVREIESPPGAIKYRNGNSNTRTVWTVVYRCRMRLIVKDPEGNPLAHYDDGAAGDAINLPSLGDAHDFAMKTAMSQALKRCAVNLGDQFGLSLYNGGSLFPEVVGTLAPPTSGEHDAPPDTDRPVIGGDSERPPSDPTDDEALKVQREAEQQRRQTERDAQAPPVSGALEKYIGMVIAARSQRIADALVKSVTGAKAEADVTDAIPADAKAVLQRAGLWDGTSTICAQGFARMAFEYLAGGVSIAATIDQHRAQQ